MNTVSKQNQLRTAFVNMASNPAFKLFLNKVQQLKAGRQAQLASHCQAQVNQASLARLNFLISQRNAYNKVLDILDELSDDLDLRKDKDN